MIRLAYFNRAVDRIDKIVTIAREKIVDVQLALLQIFFRVEQREQPFNLARGGLFALGAVVDETSAQKMKMIKNFLAAALERFGERGVHLHQRIVQPVELC